ncbi:MAG: tRNA-uridine aminocarboxypropyltransferase [Myxococcota bacterium]
MTDVAPTFRELCLRCRRPRSVCWCHALTPVDSGTRVVFIQHPREARVPVSTCRMAHLSLPNSELHVALKAEGNARLEAVCAMPGTAVLFPSESATDVDALTAPPAQLVVVDGTWSNAKKIVEKCPVLSKLPRLKLQPRQPGNYRIRKEPAEHCLATIEAVAYVLERLERAPGRFTPMLRVFDAMVEKQLDFIEANGNQSRHLRRLRRRNSVKFDPTAELRAAAERLVVVFGESNAWPLDDPNRPLPDDPELIQLVAGRVLPGASAMDVGFFSTLLQPKRPLGPRVPLHLDLPRAALLAAPPRAEAFAALHGFLREDDVLVGWGGYCADLLGKEGALRHHFLDLRGIVARSWNARPGSVELLAQRLAVLLPDGQGRAARRLEALREVTRAVLDGRLAQPPISGGDAAVAP